MIHDVNYLNIKNSKINTSISQIVNHIDDVITNAVGIYN